MNDQLLAALNWRYATKQFDPSRKISPADWDLLEEVLRLTPSSYGLQPWNFLIVENPDVRATLQPASYGQTQIVDASHLLVITAKVDLTEADVDAYLAKIAETRGVPVESLDAYRGMMVGGVVQGKSAEERRAWAFNQAYIAIGNITTSAALLGIDACPMEGFSRDEYDKILGLTEQGLGSVAVVTLGYRSPEDKYADAPKVRFDRAEVVRHI